jgi:cell volume regulation protein A
VLGQAIATRANFDWLRLCGAAPIILATFPLVVGVERAEVMFDLVFFVLLSSVLVQGIMVAPAARWIGLHIPEQKRLPSTIQIAEGSNVQPVDIYVAPNSPKARQKLTKRPKA